MHGKDDLIANETLFGQRAGGERFPITIEIGRPFKWGGTSPTEWGCAILAEPFFERTKFHGEGSLQALCLGLQYVHWCLENFKDEGGLLVGMDGQEWRLQSYWPDNPCGPGWPT